MIALGNSYNTYHNTLDIMLTYTHLFDCGIVVVCMCIPQNIEPGLQLGEDFYSLSYSMLFVGNSAAAIACGLLFNLIPTWYLFLSCIFIHITSYTFYSLATAGWMMLLSRTLAGLAMGSSVTLTFSYFGVSHFKYVEDLKEVERYEEKAAARTKGFIFSLYNIGNLLGYAIGGGKLCGTWCDDSWWYTEYCV